MTGWTTAIIVAVARNGVIGAAQDMPWQLSTDLKRFRSITMGRPVIMGRKTFQSIGRPLPGRLNIVVSASGFDHEGIVVAPDMESALESAREAEPGEVFIIGGGQIYAAALSLAERLYVTHVEAEPDGDTHFPVIDDSLWMERSSEHIPAGERDTYPTRFVIYDRRTSDTIG